MIRIVFEKNSATKDPRVFSYEGEAEREIFKVVSIELLPMRRCIVKYHADPLRIVGGAVETDLISGEYEIEVER